MQSQANKKMIIGLSLVGVILLGFAAYTFLTRGAEETGIVADQTVPVGREVIRLLNELSAIHIDKKFIETDIYQSLFDFSVPITEEEIGKESPFAPIGE